MAMIRREYNAYSYKEAVEAAKKDGLVVKINKTESFKAAGRPVGEAFKRFGADALEKAKITAPGEGFMLVLRTGKADNKNRPYKYHNTVREGAMRKECYFEWKRADNGTIVASFKGSEVHKAEAIARGKEIMKDLKTDLVLERVYRGVDGTGIEGTLTYEPSIHTEIGTYVFVGNEPATF